MLTNNLGSVTSENLSAVSEDPVSGHDSGGTLGADLETRPRQLAVPLLCLWFASRWSNSK